MVSSVFCMTNMLVMLSQKAAAILVTYLVLLSLLSCITSLLLPLASLKY